LRLALAKVPTFGGTVMEQPLGVMGTPGLGFFSLIIIGGLAGWIGGMIVGSRHGILTNILVGIVGSWIGSELADMFHLAVYGGIRHFLAALIGAIIVLLIWQGIQGRSAPPR
jgi:uncharacterized membrane protein YeaQ/YmgE (transglycosylase-associated protein family)